MSGHLQGNSKSFGRPPTRRSWPLSKLFSSPRTDFDIPFIGHRPLVLDWIYFRIPFTEHGYWNVLVLS